MARGLRVAYLVNQYPKVSHTFIRREIQALERQGVVVHRFALRGWDDDLADAADVSERSQTRYVLRDGPLPLASAIVTTVLQRPRAFVRALGLALRMGKRADRPWPYHLVYLAEACRLAAWLRASKSMHLHAHFGTNPAEVAMLARELDGPPYSFTVHGPEEFDRPAALHLSEKMRRAAFVVAISSFGRSQLYRCIGQADWSKIRVVHCGVGPEFSANAGRAVAMSSGRFVCVGRLCEQKGQMLLLDAAAKLSGRGFPFELVLAGDGELRGVIEHRIEALGLGNQVRITGWIGGADVQAEILAARALVLPSFAEGLPVVIMEAMALGRPVISTFVAGIPELVRPGQEGWLVPAGDVDALVAALEQCLAMPAADLAALGERARRRVLERHDVDAEAAKLADAFVASIG